MGKVEWVMSLQQSRCAMIRYGKLTDAQILKKIIEICQLENVSHTDDGLEAIIFTAQGDLRQVSYPYSISILIIIQIIINALLGLE